MGAGLVVVEIKKGSITSIVDAANVSYGNLIKAEKEFERVFGQPIDEVIPHFKERKEYRNDKYDDEHYDKLNSQEEREKYVYEIKNKNSIKNLVKVQDKFRELLKEKYGGKMEIDKNNRIKTSINIKFEEGWLQRICHDILTKWYAYIILF